MQTKIEISNAKTKAMESIDWEKEAKEYAGKEWNTLSEREKDEIISDMQKDWQRSHHFADGGETDETIYIYDDEEYSADELIKLADEMAYYENEDYNEGVVVDNLYSAIAFLGEDEVKIKGDVVEGEGKLVYDRDEYNKLLSKYDSIGAMLEDATSESERMAYKKQLEKLESMIHRYERGYADGGMIGDRVKVSDFTDYSYHNTLESAKEYADNLRARGYEAIVTESPSGYEAKHRVLWKKSIRDSRNEKRVYYSGGETDEYAKGGVVSKKKMLDYLNMYFDYYDELRTIAIEEDNILTRKMLPSLTDEQIEMAYDDAKYEIKADTHYAKGGSLGKTNTDRIKNLVKNLENTPHSVGLAILRERLLTYSEHNLKSLEKNPEAWSNPMIGSGMYKDFFERVIKYTNFDTNQNVGNAKAIKNLIKDLDSTPYSIGMGILRERLLTMSEIDLKLLKKNPKAWSNPFLSSGMYEDYFERVIKYTSFDDSYEDGGMMAKGGMTKHGLKKGDVIGMSKGFSVYVYNKFDKEYYIVNLDKGERSEANLSYAVRDSYFADGGMMAKGGVHKVNKKYAYFAVNKKTNKIVDGWEIVDDVESLKYYAKMDLEDNDLNPKDYNLLSAKTLKARGIDPYSWDSWAKTGEYRMGGATFQNKVDAIAENLEGTKVKPKYQKENGKTYDKKESIVAAKRIAGAMMKK